MQALPGDVYPKISFLTLLPPWIRQKRSSSQLAGFISLLRCNRTLLCSPLLLPYFPFPLHSLSQPHPSSCLSPSPNLRRDISHNREGGKQVIKRRVSNQLLYSASLRNWDYGNYCIFTCIPRGYPSIQVIEDDFHETPILSGTEISKRIYYHTYFKTLRQCPGILEISNNIFINFQFFLILSKVPDFWVLE